MAHVLVIVGFLLGLTIDGQSARAGQADDPLKTALELHDGGKVKEAIVEYDKVIKANPKLAEAYFNRGNAHFDLGQNQQAVRDYSEAIRLNPKDAEAYFNPRQHLPAFETRPGRAQRLYQRHQAQSRRRQELYQSRQHSLRRAPL